MASPVVRFFQIHGCCQPFAPLVFIPSGGAFFLHSRAVE